MNEIDYEEDNSILTDNSKVTTYLDLPEKIKRSFISNNNNIVPKNGKEMNKMMIDFIKKLLKIKKEGKEDFYSTLSQMLREINSNITHIIDDNNNTLAHFLANEENIELLKIICNIYYLLLINKNEFYDWFLKENTENLTILDIASIKSNKEMLEYLYEIVSRTDGSKLKFNIKKNNFFHFSAKYDKYYSILFWYDKLQPYFPYLKIIDICNEYDITPLHYASYHGSLNCVELLLDLQADINAIDKDGKSVLTYAVYSGNIKLIKKLLIRGANKDIKDLEGKTSYHYAIEKNKFGIANLLKDFNYIDNIKKYIYCNNNNFEIQQLQKYRYDFEIILYLLFYLILIIIFTIRLFCVSNYDDLKKSSYYMFLKIGFYCLGLIYILLFISFLFIIYFKCVISFKQHIKKKKKDYLTMYDDTYNICIKCIRIKKANTIHCAVCNLCIDDWDHHCFWLNTCISKNNMKIFTCFLISIISFLFINIVFSLSFLIAYFTKNNEQFLNYIFSNKEYSYNKNKIWIWKLIYLLFFIIFFILFLFLFTYHFSLIIFSTPKSIKTIEVNDLRGPSYLNNNYSDDYHINLIDNSVDKSDD